MSRRAPLADAWSRINDLDRRVTALQRGVGPPAWISVNGGVGYQAGWADRTFGVFNGAQYRKVGDIVYLRGLVVRSSGTGQPIFGLPDGYSPTHQEAWVVDAGQAFGELEVTPAGVVLFTTGTATNYVSLSGVSFSTT